MSHPVHPGHSYHPIPMTFRSVLPSFPHTFTVSQSVPDNGPMYAPNHLYNNTPAPGAHHPMNTGLSHISPHSLAHSHNAGAAAAGPNGASAPPMDEMTQNMLATMLAIQRQQQERQVQSQQQQQLANLLAYSNAFNNNMSMFIPTNAGHAMNTWLPQSNHAAAPNTTMATAHMPPTPAHAINSRPIVPNTPANIIPVLTQAPVIPLPVRSRPSSNKSKGSSSSSSKNKSALTLAVPIASVSPASSSSPSASVTSIPAAVVAKVVDSPVKPTKSAGNSSKPSIQSIQTPTSASLPSHHLPTMASIVDPSSLSDANTSSQVAEIMNSISKVSNEAHSAALTSGSVSLANMHSPSNSDASNSIAALISATMGTLLSTNKTTFPSTPSGNMSVPIPDVLIASASNTKSHRGSTAVVGTHGDDDGAIEEIEDGEIDDDEDGEFEDLEESIEPVQTADGEARYVCPHLPCNCVFSSRASLSHHVRRYHTTKPFKCRFAGCRKIFACSATRNRHENGYHKQGKKWVCETCGMKFVYPSALKIHQRTHTGERPFRCEECGQRFKRATHVREHMRIHTGEKPFSCSACGRSFSRSFSLKVHVCSSEATN